MSRLFTTVVRAFADLITLNDLAQQAYKAAVAQAKRDVSDATAAEALRGELVDISGAVIDRQLERWGPRSDYLNDRAYRLLAAARVGGLVAPISFDRRAEFEFDATLGRLPVAQAFSLLARSEPNLLKMEEAAMANEIPKMSEVGALVGPGAKASDPILKRPIAVRITSIHLRDCARGRPDHVLSYFDRSSSSRVTVGYTPTYEP